MEDIKPDRFKVMSDEERKEVRGLLRSIRLNSRQTLDKAQELLDYLDAYEMYGFYPPDIKTISCKMINRDPRGMWKLTFVMKNGDVRVFHSDRPFSDYETFGDFIRNKRKKEKEDERCTVLT